MKHHRKQATVHLKKMGQSVEILRKSGGATNALGKTEGDSWDSVATEYGVLNTGGGRSMRQIITSGGEFDQENPGLVLTWDSRAEDGDRVIISGTTYEIKTIVDSPTHKSAALVSVSG